MIPNGQVAIIGAGAAGLCAARAYLSAGFRVRVYEASADIGGTWSYDPESSATSCLYESLRCNIPKQIMSFPDMDFPAHAKSFLSHRDVLAYLLEYTKRHDLRPHVACSSPVDKIWKDGAQWNVRVGDEVSLHDAVIIATGHFHVPNDWRPAGTEQFIASGRTVSHSNLYKEPSRFRNRSVVVVGAGPSGNDIALEISTVARSVVLAHSNYSEKLFADKVPQTACVAAVSANGDVKLENGQILHDIDDVLLCTGYQYVFPFLDNGTAGVCVTPNKRAVKGLIAQLVAGEDPTLAIMGLPWRIIPFPLFDTQALFLAALHQGRVPLAELEKLRKYDPDDQDEHENKYYHVLADAQWEYRRRLAGLCGCAMPNASEIAIARDASAARKRIPRFYRELEYYILGPGPDEWRVAFRGVDITGRDDPDFSDADEV